PPYHRASATGKAAPATSEVGALSLLCIIGSVILAQSNLEIFKSIIERGFSHGDLSVADEVCAERLLEHEYLSKTDVPGPDILKSQIEEARNSIKGLTLTLEASIETEDTVWARCRATGFDP